MTEENGNGDGCFSMAKHMLVGGALLLLVLLLAACERDAVIRGTAEGLCGWLVIVPCLYIFYKKGG